MKKIVIAVGGNALLQPNEPLTADRLRVNSINAASIIAKIAQQYQVVIVHGNGPQVGLLALQAETYQAVKPYPFDILNAESQGMIGYLLQQAFCNVLTSRDVITVVTQVLVDEHDPAFLQPTKPIGPFYQQHEIEIVRQQRPQYSFQETQQGFRRVVASPYPKSIIELSVIESLIQQNVFVIAAGGGGIPCVQGTQGELSGVEAVIDKDLSASLLARSLNADHLVILTNVDAVYEGWGTAMTKAIDAIQVKDLLKMTFEKGSMAPKIHAACEFVSFTGQTAHIGHLNELVAILKGQSGTRILPNKT